MKTIAISQSNYIPWKGYFDQIARVDEFVVYDSVQYTRRDWRNRNKIKTPTGLAWLTIPVSVKAKYHQSIIETRIQGDDWVSSHLKSIFLNYSKATYFNEVYPSLESAYSQCTSKSLSETNMTLLLSLSKLLGIRTKISRCSDYDLYEGKNERLLSICLQAGANIYLSGPSACSYLDHNLFKKHGIEILYMNYENYPEYNQLWGPFRHHVTVVDLLMNCGSSSAKYLKYIDQ